jgi:hypothetical protein
MVEDEKSSTPVEDGKSTSEGDASWSFGSGRGAKRIVDFFLVNGDPSGSSEEEACAPGEYCLGESVGVAKPPMDPGESTVEPKGEGGGEVEEDAVRGGLMTTDQQLAPHRSRDAQDAISETHLSRMPFGFASSRAALDTKMDGGIDTCGGPNSSRERLRWTVRELRRSKSARMGKLL